MRKRIAVVGAGPGGLSAALILSRQGHDVTVYEKDHEVGGRSKRLMLGNFCFDTGPTFLMYVELLEDVFRRGGYDLHKELDLINLDPLYRLVFPFHTFELRTDKDQNKAAFDAYDKDAGDAYLKWRKVQKKKLDAVTPLLKRSFASIFDYVKPDTLRMLPRLHPFQSVYQSLYKLNPSPGFIHALSFQAKYLGMASFDAPSAFSFLPFLEHAGGLFHTEGGLNAINRKMAELIIKNGGKVLTETPVEQILVKDRKAYGVKVKGMDVAYDAVVANADFAYMATKLIDNDQLRKYTHEKVAKKEYSVSTLNIYLGLDTLLPFGHHQIVFSDDYDDYLRRLSKGEFTDDISYYIHNPSVIDKTMAPEGQSALYLLVPLPNMTSPKDWASYQSHIENLLYQSIKKKFDIDLKAHTVTKMIITPKDWQDDYNVYQGAVFNLSHKLSQMMYYRPHNNFEDIKGLYLVGGGTHPGSGLPTIYQSAIITSKYLEKG